MKRRSFLGNLMLAAPAVVLGMKEKALAQIVESARAGSAWIPHGRRISIMQGMTNATSTQIIVLAPVREALRYEALDPSGQTLEIQVEAPSHGENSKYMTVRLTVKGLALGVKYTLRIFGNGNALLDVRHFRALDLQKKNVRLAFMSCMDDKSNVHKQMWAEVIAVRPDIMFFLGDNVYVDSEDIGNSPEYMWNRYVETRLLLDIFQVKELIPTLATWDDHDYGVDNGNRLFDLKDESMRIYKAFFGMNETAEYKNGPGVASYLEAFGQRIVLFDDRYWRDPDEGHGGTAKQWGPEQVSWVFSKLDPASKDPILLFNGSQYFGEYHNNESVEREAHGEFLEVRRQLGSFNAPVILGSGDVHYAEVMNIEASLFGYPTFEFTTSAMHSAEADTIKHNHRRIFAGAHNNFMLAEMASSPGVMDIKLTVHGVRGTIYYTGSHTVRKNGSGE